MTPHSFNLRLTEALKRRAAGVRGGHVVALTVVGVVALGLAGLRSFDLPGPRPIVDGERMTIEVVPPVEPEVTAGSVMEVGELMNGFTGPPPRPPEPTPVGWSADDEWNEADDAPPPPPPPVRRASTEADVRRPVEPPPPARIRESRWFGFDAPRRDFEGERAARRARREARERRAWEEREEARWRERDLRRDDRDRERWVEDPPPEPYAYRW